MTQSSLQIFTYNEDCTRHKYLKDVFIVHCTLIKNTKDQEKEKKLGVTELKAS